MYCPAAFAMSRDDEVELIKRQPLATVVVRLPEPAGLVAHKLPLSVVSVWCGVDGADRVVLRGHCAAKNPLAHLLRYGAECLLVFDGDRAYVSPLFMGLPEPHKNAVPTYNYEVVQLRGIASLLDDKEEVRAIVTQLSNEQEAQFGARAWKVEDGDPYIETQLEKIVGIEFVCTLIKGKKKWSQNKSAAMQKSIAEHLDLGKTNSDVAERSWMRFVGALAVAAVAGVALGAFWTLPRK